MKLKNGAGGVDGEERMMKLRSGRRNMGKRAAEWWKGGKGTEKEVLQGDAHSANGL